MFLAQLGQVATLSVSCAQCGEVGPDALKKTL